MLSVVQVIQESEVRRREVGCQWESPEEERKEVGCQSDSAERRDAAVQVDLLTQQLSWRDTGVCGVAWQCVSVRADEPGGGALLQHCCTHRTHTLDTGQHIHHSPPLYLFCSPLSHTMPVFGPPAPPDLQQPTSLPSMPLCGLSPTTGGRCEASPPPTPADVSTPPPGLIAPLSPRLAEEEEEEEEEEGLLKHENNESFRGNIRSTTTAEKKRRRKSQCLMFGEKSWPALKLTKHIAGRVQPSSTARGQRKMDNNEKLQPERRQDVIQSEERSSIREMPSNVNSKTRRGETRQPCRKRGIKTGRLAPQIQRTRAEGGGNKTKKVEEKRLLEEEEVKTEETEQAGRPRRKAVGPPIRYLIESEEQSHCPSAANHSKACGAKVERKLGRLKKEHQEEERRGGVELTERTQDNIRMDGGVGGRRQLCQVCGLIFTRQSSLQLHLSVHRAGRRPSCHLCNKKFSCANTLRLHHLRHHHGNPGGHRGNGATPGGTQAANDKWDEEVLLRTPTKAPDWSRRRKRLCRNPRWWVDYRTTKRKRHDVERWRRQQEREARRERKRCREEEEEEVKRVCLKEDGGGEEGEEKEEEKERQTEVKREVVEQPQRPRRKMVGPPIRYLLESEGQSHGPVTANQDRGWGCKQGRKPQKKSEAGGGASDDTAMIDRLEDTEQTNRQAGWTVTERQMGRTNQDRANGPKQRGRPKKVVIDSEAGGGAAERQTGHMITERQTGQKATERQTGQTLTERQTGHMITERQTGQKATERQTGQTLTERQTSHMITEGQTGQTLTERQTSYMITGRQTSHMITEGQTGHMITERQTSQTLTERQTSHMITEGQTGQTLTERPASHMITGRQTSHMITERQTGQTLSERQTALVYIDLQSRQVTVISPCSVRLQRLL